MGADADDAQVQQAINCSPLYRLMNRYPIGQQVPKLANDPRFLTISGEKQRVAIAAHSSFKAPRPFMVF